MAWIIIVYKNFAAVLGSNKQIFWGLATLYVGFLLELTYFFSLKLIRLQMSSYLRERQVRMRLIRSNRVTIQIKSDKPRFEHKLHAI